LRRGSDRAEATVYAVLLAVFLAGAPLAALAAVGWAHHGGQHAGHAQPSGHPLLAGAFAVLILAELLCGAAVAVHGLVDRRRMAAWAVEWRATGPKWSRHG
jgi:hypothetical protein